MKRLLISIPIAALMLMFATETSQAQFHADGQWVGGQILVTDPIGFGGMYEHALNENMSVGGQIRFWHWSTDIFRATLSETIIMPQGIFNYHFMPREQVDPYAGARLGFAIYDYSYEAENQQIDPFNADEGAGTSSLFLTLAGGVRYFFSPQWSGQAELEFEVAGEDYFGSSIMVAFGVNYTLP